MYMREKRVLLRHYLEQGVAKAELARRLCVSRRTIYHWIGTGQLERDLDAEPVRYRPCPPVPTKLDPYRGIITARLETFPALTAQRLFDEVRAAGYPGGYTQVKAYVRQVRPRPPVAPVVRFETPPGYQGQVDFGTFALPWGRRHALLIVLGYSRLKVESPQHEERREKARCLTAREMEEKTQRHGGLDREVRVLPLRASRARSVRVPGDDGRRGQPDGDVASTDQRAIRGGPVLDVVLCLVRGMDSRRHPSSLVCPLATSLRIVE